MKLLGLILFLISFNSQAFINITLPTFPGFGGFGPTGSTVYIPQSLESNTSLRPAIVVLHGCLQSGSDILKASKLDRLAEDNDLYVIVPEQSFQANPMRCWNWFEAKNQKRDQNEIATILKSINTALVDHPIDPSKIIIAGFSAGAAMANNIAYCHSDMFAGVLSMAGVKYAGATSSLDAFNVMRSGSRVSAQDSAIAGFNCLNGNAVNEQMKYLVVNGTSDNIVSHVNATQLVESNMVYYDLLDDANVNGSITFTNQTDVKQVQNGRRYQETTFIDSHTNEILMKEFLVEGMSHAWSGGKTNVQYSDANGPDITAMLIDFFNLK